MTTNVSIPSHPEEQIAALLSQIDQPARIQILLVIATQEACVCHLEAVTGMRQASISQHLMTLRKAGLVTPNRAGRNIFYRLAQPEIIGILQQAALFARIDPEALNAMAGRPIAGCPCPQCNPDMDPKFTCNNPSPASNSRRKPE